MNALIALLLAAAAPAEDAPVLQLPKDVRPVHYALRLTIDPKRERFAGAEEIDVELDRPRGVLWLHGQNLHVTAAAVGDAPATWEQVNPEGLAKVTLQKPAGPGRVKLHLEWDAAYDPRLVGLYLAHEAGAPYAFSFFEAVDARRAFPCFDEPVFKTPYDVTLEVPRTDEAIGNTNVVEEKPGSEPGLKSVRFGTTAPLPTYLVAWAVGPFDIVSPPPLPPNEVRKTPLSVRGVAPRGRGKELAYALQAAGELLVTLERYFGIPYPYEKLDHVAVPDFAWGAEEHAGAIHYRESLLLYTPGKTSEEVKANIASIMSHEMAHQWFGNLVTMRWWDDTWLNEGFATWMGYRAAHTWNPALQMDLTSLLGVDTAMETDSLASARAVRQPVTDIRNVGDAFDDITYKKGDGVLAMFEHFVGAEPFRQGVNGYLREHAFGGGSTDDLLQSIARASGREVVGPFHSFLDQEGLPLVKASLRCAGSAAALDLTQARFLPLGSKASPDRQWQIPVCARYQIGAQERESCTLLAAKSAPLLLDRRPGEPCPSWVMPSAAGAGYYRWQLDPEALGKLQKAGYARLPPVERMSVAHAILAGLRTGAITEADGLRALEPIARDPLGRVAGEARPALAFASEQLATPELRRVVEQYAADLYRPAMRHLGWKAAAGEPVFVRRERSKLISFLALVVHDPEVHREAARRGRAYVASGKVHPEAVDPDLTLVALEAAAQEGNASFFDLLWGMVKASDDLELRGRLLKALASAEEPSLSARALSLSLDPALRTTERVSVLQRQAEQPATREATFRFVQAHFDELVEKIPNYHASFLPRMAAGLCDERHLAEAEAFFGPRAPKVPGMSRSASEAAESQRLCIAQVAAQRESANGFFRAVAKRRGAPASQGRAAGP